MDTPVLLELKNIDKKFPGVHALENVDFSLVRGEIVALIGENGAGKSTLMKILSGIYQKDNGEMILKGTEVHPMSPSEAIALGISIIHQELNLVPEMKVYENIFLGQEKRKSGLYNRILKSVNKTWMIKETQKLLDRLGAEFEPTDQVKTLSVAQQQMVEIAKSLSQSAEILIMDEPTSSLTQSDVETLFKIIKNMKENGVTIIFITHRLEEIFRIADRVSVLRDGKMVGELSIEEATPQKVITLMVGRSLDQLFPKEIIDIGGPVLHVHNLNRGKKVRNINFEVRKGEILGIAGLVGAGRTEMVRALFGIDEKDSGDFTVEGIHVDINSPRVAIRHGLGLVPEDRKDQGLILRMAVYQNITLASLKAYTRGLVLSKTEEHAVSEEFVDKLRIRTTSVNNMVHNLSGGNQQKVVLAKWLALRPKVLILDEPTRGIDVGSKAEIHSLITQFAKQGMGIILISSELPELLGMCDRILVMSKGTITGEFTSEEADQEKIMACAVATV